LSESVDYRAGDGNDPIALRGERRADSLFADPLDRPELRPPEALRAPSGVDEAAIASLLQTRASASARPAVMLGHAFMITTGANGTGRIQVKRSAVIRLTGRENAPFRVYRWN
jgi:hypothetical protein